MNARTFAFGIALMAFSTACAGEPAGERLGVETRDSAGIPIVVTTSPEAAPLWTIGPEPRLSIGAVEGDDAQQLHRVRDPVRTRDGRIVLADAGSGEIRVYDAAGRIVVRSGGDGAGPGEFRNMDWLRPYRGDSLAVYDYVLDRVSIVTSDGTFGRIVRLGEQARTGLGVQPAASRTPLARPVDVYGDGGFLARLSEVHAGPGDTSAVRRDPVPHARFDPEGRRVAPVGTFPDDEVFVYATESSRSVRPRAFGRETHLAVRAGRIYVADNGAFQVAVRDAAGRPLRIARAAVEPAPVDRAARARWTEDAVAGLRSSRLRRVAESAIRAMPFPDSMPYHGPLVVGPDGEMWLARYSPDAAAPTRWIVFGADGRVRARAETPPRFRLSQVGADDVLGVERDALDVERVVVYPLARGGAD